MSHLNTTHSYKDLKQFFDMIDTEGKGEIEYSQLIEVFNKYDVPFKEDEIKKNLIRSIGYFNNSGITLKQFIKIMTPVCSSVKKTNEDKTRIIFDKFDKNKKGHLNINEFKSLMTSFGEKFNDLEIRELFNEADLDGNGKIDYSEFKFFWENS